VGDEEVEPMARERQKQRRGERGTNDRMVDSPRRREEETRIDGEEEKEKERES